MVPLCKDKESKNSEIFRLNEYQRDEAEAFVSADRTDSDAQELPLEEILDIDPEFPAPLRIRWIFAEAVKGAVTVEDYRQRGIPDPVYYRNPPNYRSFGRFRR